jgi:hypothetical protein
MGRLETFPLPTFVALKYVEEDEAALAMKMCQDYYGNWAFVVRVEHGNLFFHMPEFSSEPF